MKHTSHANSIIGQIRIAAQQYKQQKIVFREGFQYIKSCILGAELGLNHYEGRNWRGFHYHATLCIAAYADLGFCRKFALNRLEFAALSVTHE